MTQPPNKNFPVPQQAASEWNRYFIEVQTALDHAPRSQETALRRSSASRFIAEFNDWLRREDLADKVSSLAITALGQVQIICEADIISALRHHEDMPIATIRQAAAALETMGRFAGR